MECEIFPRNIFASKFSVFVKDVDICPETYFSILEKFAAKNNVRVLSMLKSQAQYELLYGCVVLRVKMANFAVKYFIRKNFCRYFDYIDTNSNWKTVCCILRATKTERQYLDYLIERGVMNSVAMKIFAHINRREQILTSETAEIIFRSNLSECELTEIYRTQPEFWEIFYKHHPYDALKLHRKYYSEQFSNISSKIRRLKNERDKLRSYGLLASRKLKLAQSGNYDVVKFAGKIISDTKKLNYCRMMFFTNGSELSILTDIELPGGNNNHQRIFDFCDQNKKFSSAKLEWRILRRSENVIEVEDIHAPQLEPDSICINQKIPDIIAFDVVEFTLLIRAYGFHHIHYSNAKNFKLIDRDDFKFK